MERETGKIRSVVWTEVFPWLCLFRTFRPAASIRSLIIAGVAFALIFFACLGLGELFSPKTNALQPSNALFRSLMGPCSTCFTVPSGFSPAYGVEKTFDETSKFVSTSLKKDKKRDWREKAYLTSVALWKLAVWAFFGTMLCRSAAVSLTQGRRASTKGLLSFSARKWFSVFSSPLIVLIAIGVLLLPIGLLGLLFNWAFSAWITILLWPIAIVCSFIAAVLLIGLVFGFPLMWAAIGVEGTDSFDALSRTYAYLFQRPLKLLFYLVVAAAFGALGLFFVGIFADLVCGLGCWAASWWCGDFYDKIMIDGPFPWVFKLLLAFFILVKYLAACFFFSYFWTAMTAIYLLLRRDVDSVELEQVFEEGGAEAESLEPVEPSADDEKDSQES
jgi:hypothetical protein